MSYSPSSNQVLRVGTTAIGLLALTTGLRGLAYPFILGNGFGIAELPSKKAGIHSGDRNGASSLSKQERDSSDLLKVVAGRNIAGGLSLLTYTYLNDTRAMGIHMVMGLASGLTDAVICYQRGARDFAYGHAGMAGIFGSLGVALWFRSLY